MYATLDAFLLNQLLINAPAMQTGHNGLLGALVMPHAMDSNSDLAHNLAQIQQNQRSNLVDQLAHNALTPLITRFINQIKLSKQLNVIKGIKI